MKNERMINNFINDLIQVGFYKWDIDKEISADKTYFVFDTPRKRKLFTSVYGPNSHNTRVGDVNIYIDYSSDHKKYRYSDGIVHELIWSILKPIGISEVTGSINGKSRKNPIYISMVDCDRRSLIQTRSDYKQKINSKKLLKEIIYLRDTFIQIEALAETIAPSLENIARNYPLTFKPSQNRQL